MSGKRNIIELPFILPPLPPLLSIIDKSDFVLQISAKQNTISVMPTKRY
jgi:hypothetical protein